MTDAFDDPATDDPFSDSAPQTDDLGDQTSLESEGESDRDNHASKRLPPRRITADSVAEVCTSGGGPRCHKKGTFLQLPNQRGGS